MFYDDEKEESISEDVLGVVEEDDNEDDFAGGADTEAERE